MTMAKSPSFRSAFILLLVWVATGICDGLAPNSDTSRRDVLKKFVRAAAVGSIAVSPAIAIDTPEAMDVESFLRTGMVQMPMGVSGQAGKARPETGVVLRYGFSLCVHSLILYWASRCELLVSLLPLVMPPRTFLFL